MVAKGIKLSAEERKAYDYLFDKADKEQLGVLTGDKAVAFFDAAQLAPQTLGEIWAAADDENTGFLTKDQFYAVCRMIGQAQNGQEPAISRSGPLPAFKGITIPGLAKQPQLPGTSSPAPARALSPNLTGNAPGSPLRQSSTPVPAQQQGVTISPEDKAKFTRLFYNSGPSNGLIDGDKAYGILTKSGLSNEQLGQIWNLADTQSRGALDATDFTIAMALINATMSGKLRSLPDTLPVSIYAQAAAAPAAAPGSGMPTSPLRNQMTGNAPASALYPQSTGGFQGGRSVGPGSALSQSQSQSSISAFGGAPWAISPTEKAQADQFFNMLDTTQSGYIGGDIAVPFFVQSGLPEDTLASIWDLSDISKEGRLNKDEFAVARRLIMDALAGKPVPASLEENMVPPSLRATARQLQNQPQQSEVQKDLFSLMDDDEPAQQLPAAAANAFQPMQSSRVTSPAPIMPQATGSSSRGIPAPMIPTHTGGSARSGTPRAAPPPVPASRSGSTVMSPPAATAPQQAKANVFETNFGADDSDGDEPAPAAAAAPAATRGASGSEQTAERSVELGNLKNQVNQTQRSVSTLRDERKDLSGRVADIDAEIDELKVKLSQAKAAYDVESTNMSNLETRQKTGNADLKRLRQETITAESDLSALKEQKIELEQSILKDKEEIRGLKAALKGTNDQLATLKDELERLKKEGRQQKGLLAVSRKQHATAEGEREKVETAIADERREQAQLAAAPPALAAAASTPTAVSEAREVPLPASNVASPAPSAHSGRSMNPFFNSGGLAAPASTAARAPSPLNAFALPAEVETAQKDEDEDPFGMSKSGTLPQQAHAQVTAPSDSFGFDDDFGSGFASKGPATGTTQPTSSGFDDAFADFDKPAATSAPAPAAAATTAHEGDASGSRDVHEQKSTSPGIAEVAGMAAGAVLGVAGAAAAAVGLTSPDEEKDKKVEAVSPAAEETTSAPALAAADKGKGPERPAEASPFDEPEEEAVQPAAAGMQAYESRAMPDDDGEDAGSDGDLPPIRDVERTEDDDDSDSDEDGASTADDRSRVPTATGTPAIPQQQEHEEPSASAPGQSLYESQNQPGDLASSSRATNIHDTEAAAGAGEASIPDAHKLVPGSFPGSGSAPSSVGDADEAFEDARSSAPHARSVSPPSTAGGNGAANFEEPAVPAATAAAIAPAVAAPSSTGSDNAFGSPFEATSPVTQESASRGVDNLPSTASAISSTGGAVEGLPSSSAAAATKAGGDDCDDFEDLAPARIEEPAAGSAAAITKPDNGFNDNFDDDFGFDNQTFSHTITSQGVGKSTEPTGVQAGKTSTGFDDAFEDAFGTSTRAPAAAAASAGNDFFSSPSQNNTGASSNSAFPLPAGAAAAPLVPEGAMHLASDAQSAPSQPSAAAAVPREPAPTYAPPPGPPPAAAPALPTRPDTTGGEIPQVKELMDMGFKRSQAIAALEDNQFDVGRAANVLLSLQ